jgi:hypothetical protein
LPLDGKVSLDTGAEPYGLDDIGPAIETLAAEVPGQDAVYVTIMPGA